MFQNTIITCVQSLYLKPLVFQFVAVFLTETTPVSTIITCVQSLYLKPLVLQNAVITFVQFLYLRPLVLQIAIVTLTQVICLRQKTDINAQNKFAICASIIMQVIYLGQKQKLMLRINLQFLPQLESSKPIQNFKEQHKQNSCQINTFLLVVIQILKKDIRNSCHLNKIYTSQAERKNFKQFIFNYEKIYL